MNIAILTTSGLFLLLRWVHFIFVIIWMSSVCLRFFSKRENPFSSLLVKLSAGLALLSGGVLFAWTPTPLQSSWGATMLLGSLVALVMFINQFIPAPREESLASADFILLFPVSFFMSMSSHLGMQLQSSASLVKMLAIAVTPALALNIVLLAAKRPLLNRPVPAAASGLTLTFITYFLLEVFSK